MVDVIPVSDPNSSTMAQRVVQYQAVLQMSQQAPQIYDLPVLHREMIEVMGIKNADKIVPTKDDAKPADPISENMNILNMKPIKAFIEQDHDAHIAAHQAFMQDPMVMQALGQNPKAQQMMASLQAHLAEHLAFKYRKAVEEKLGAQLPPPNAELPKEIEVSISRLASKAGQQLMQQNKQQAAQAQAQQQQQDPLIQMQQAELQVKQAEQQRKMQKDQTDAQLKQQELQIKAQGTMADIQAKQTELELERAELELDMKKAGEKLDADSARDNLKLNAELRKATIDSVKQNKT